MNHIAHTRRPVFSHPSRRHGRHRDKVRGTLILILVLVPILAAAGWYIADAMNAPEFDPGTFCQVGVPAPAETVILVDKTDTLSPRQMAAVRREFSALASTETSPITVGGRISVQVIDGSAGSLGWAKPVDSFCRPPLHSAESGTGATDRYLRPAFDRYVRRLNDVADQVAAAAAVSQVSPILEGIQAVSRMPDFASATGPRTLVLASDLLQHVPPYISELDAASTDYKQKLSGTTYGHDTTADLRGVTVRVLYLERKRARSLQLPSHLDAWRQRFAAEHAKNIDVTRLPE